MPGANTILRVIGGTLALVVVAFVTAVGYALMDPIYQDVIDPDLFARLGWGTPHKTVMLFAGLALIGMSMVVIIWWLVAPVRQDVRQQTGPPF